MSSCDPRLVNLDGPTRELALLMLPALQVELPTATIGDLYTGAARIGMNRLASILRSVTGAEVALRQGVDVQSLIVMVYHHDSSRATEVGLPLGLDMYCMLSCAVSTGVMAMSGHDIIVGPFASP